MSYKMTEPKEVEPAKLYQYEIMDRTHIICELIDSSLLNNAGITPKQTQLVNKALDFLGNVYQDAGVKSYEPNTTTIPTAKYEQLKADAELLDWLSDKNQNIGNVELPTECVVQNLHSLRDAIRCAKAKYQARGK